MTDQKPEELGARLERLAAQSDLPLFQDTAVTGALSQLPPASDIPPQLYSAVAAVLSFLRDAEEQADT